ncbi:glycosyltransferase [Aureimonas sp. ME7]|uniref:glycosyltransferase n=1 Tax=Aureimonas sp. ME7 TaxID=2744252 RepID=UPI0015F524C3|nr:glycosyltransferase [Aureimonas sp. ME7]
MLRLTEYSHTDVEARGTLLGAAQVAAEIAGAQRDALGCAASAVEVLHRILETCGITQTEFQNALLAARLHGSSVDEELMAGTVVSARELASATAEALGLVQEDIDPNATLLRDGRGALAASERHAKTCDGALRARLYLAPKLERLDTLIAGLRRTPGLARSLRITTLADIAALREAADKTERSNRARLSLAADHNRWSARDVLTPLQAALLVVLLMLLAHGWYASPQWFWFALHATASSAALGLTLFRLRVLVGTVRERSRAPSRPPPPAAPDTAAPLYSVLVALHREADMAAPLAKAMAELDWPRSRLEVFFVCEANDPATIAAVERAIEHQPNFSVIATPRTYPTTKPKALNFALPLARGEYLVLFDAEDRPHPQQLRAAHEAFRTHPPELACVQAPLVIRNAGNGWLETLFALEYAVLFRAVLPWLAKRSLPVTRKNGWHGAGLGGIDREMVVEALI